MESTKEVLAFEDLSPYLLLKNGNFLYRIPFRGGWAVLKVYYGSRSNLSRVKKSVSNVLGGQTSYMPKTRLRIERECIELWSRHGFRVFELFEDVEVRAPDCPPGGYMLFEYVEAPKMIDHLRDEEVPIDERMETYRRFMQEWSRRHELAITLSEPRLVHENGDFKHVFILEDAFLWFDFEMVYRHRAKTGYYVAHEILQYLWQILRGMSEETQERLLDETVAHYPVRERLESIYRFFFLNPNPLVRCARVVDRRLTKRGRKPTSKYNVVRRLSERLEAR